MMLTKKKQNYSLFGSEDITLAIYNSGRPTDVPSSWIMRRQQNSKSLTKKPYIKNIKIYIKILTWLQGTKLQIFHDSIALKFTEETWAQRKPNQI